MFNYVYDKQVARGSSVKPENERVKVSYDEINQRVREIPDSPLIPKPGQEMYEVIYLHQTVSYAYIHEVTSSF